MQSQPRIVFNRDIETLRAEVELYPEDELLWRDVPGLPNPGGTRLQLCDGIALASAEVSRTLSSLDAVRLDEPFPIPAYGRSVVTGLSLLHPSTHLAYHLGQLDYHRRVVTGDRRGAGAVSMAPLFSPPS